MHPSKFFRSATKEQNLSFARDRGFGVLTINGPNGPIASHIPYVLSQDKASFSAHLVRSHPIVKLLEETRPALMIISGPDGYVSPDWYGIDDQVPTWNYIAVHMRGTLQKLPVDDLRPHLQALSKQFESRLSPKPEWTIDKMTTDVLAKLEDMIVPINFMIESVDGTWKMAQNKPDLARLGAADGLAVSDIGQMVVELSELMRLADNKGT